MGLRFRRWSRRFGRCESRIWRGVGRRDDRRRSLLRLRLCRWSGRFGRCDSRSCRCVGRRDDRRRSLLRLRFCRWSGRVRWCDGRGCRCVGRRDDRRRSLLRLRFCRWSGRFGRCDTRSCRCVGRRDDRRRGLLRLRFRRGSGRFRRCDSRGCRCVVRGDGRRGRRRGLLRLRFRRWSGRFGRCGSLSCRCVVRGDGRCRGLLRLRFRRWSGRFRRGHSRGCRWVGHGDRPRGVRGRGLRRCRCSGWYGQGGRKSGWHVRHRANRLSLCRGHRRMRLHGWSGWFRRCDRRNCRRIIVGDGRRGWLISEHDRHRALRRFRFDGYRLRYCQGTQVRQPDQAGRGIGHGPTRSVRSASLIDVSSSRVCSGDVNQHLPARHRGEDEQDDHHTSGAGDAAHPARRTCDDRRGDRHVSGIRLRRWLRRRSRPPGIGIVTILGRMSAGRFEGSRHAGIQLRRSLIDQCRSEPVIVLLDPKRRGERQQ